MIKSIERETFSGCSRLTDVVLPKGLKKIDLMAFAFCPSLTNIYYLGSSDEWKDIEIFDFNDSLMKANKYFYSNEKPSVEGIYWHFVDNIPTVW